MEVFAEQDLMYQGESYKAGQSIIFETYERRLERFRNKKAMGAVFKDKSKKFELKDLVYLNVFCVPVLY
jgi:hypothetical protein